MFSTSFVWVLLASLLSNGGGKHGVKEAQRGDASIKEESDDEEADASSQDDQADPSQRDIKREEEFDEDHRDAPVSEVAGSHTDSGAGTGLETAEARGVQRRRSHLSQGEHS